MKKKFPLLSFATAALLLMAFQCDDDEQLIFANDLQVAFSQGPSFQIGDTLWLRGRVSANVYDSELRDSVFDPNFGFRSEFTLSQIIGVSSQQTNTIDISDALRDFILVAEAGSTEFGNCSTSELRIQAELDEPNEQYVYEIGLVAQSAGDYIIHLFEGTLISNSDRNLDLLDDYSTAGQNPFLDCLDCCFNFSLDVEATNGDYLFRIE